MKLAIVIIITVLLQIPLSADSQTLTFSGKEVPLKDVLKIIKCQTGVGFFYDAALFKDAKPVSVEWKNISLDKALDEIFKDLSVGWKLENKTVTIFKKPLQVVTTGPLR
jgi:TonB-dependent starch-binding outer membrane protein SusC